MNVTIDQIIRQLQYKTMEKLDSVKPVVIKNLHYKIQDLNVSERKGTMNVGLTGEVDGETFAKWAGEGEPGQSGSGSENDNKE
ncbi:MAG TPA: hypothetical protein VFK44_15130 [Bacillales bacterium]|nr:hypothetical protein [Bacillales bacterium]